jgi:hypothetical protein
MLNTYNTQSRRDYTLLEGAIRTQLTNEGTSLEGLDDQIAKITQGYLVVVKCLWSRISDSNVDKFIVDKQDLAQGFVNLLTKYAFDDLVYTFRQRFMNHKTKKVMTSVPNLTTYIVDIFDGSQKVIAKASKPKAPKKSNAKALKVAPATPLTNAFITPSTTKVVSKPKSTRTSKEVPVKVAKKSKSGKSWINHDMTKLPHENDFLRINLKTTMRHRGDGVDYVFGRFQYVATDKNNKFVVLRTKVIGDNKYEYVQAHIPMQNIASVRKYA